MGNAGPRGGPRGDVLVVFDVQDDPRFERDGEDLYTEVLVVVSAARVRRGRGSAGYHRYAACAHPGRNAERAGVAPARPRATARERVEASAICTCACSCGHRMRSTPEEEALIAQLATMQRVPRSPAREGVLDSDEGSVRRVNWSAVRILPGENASGRDAIVAALFARGAQAIVEDGPAIVTHFRATTDLSGSARRYWLPIHGDNHRGADPRRGLERRVALARASA